MHDKFRVGLTRDFLDQDGNPVFGDIGLGLLETLSHVEIEYLKDFELVMPPEQIQDYDALIVLKPKISRDSLRGIERLTVIARFGVGYDNIDVEACTDASVLLFITPEGVRYPMAESVVTWMLMLSKRALEKDRQLRSGIWNRHVRLGTCLQHRVLGLVGLGNISREVVRLLAPFGMRILASDPYIIPEQAAKLGVELVNLADLLSQADYVSIHCLLNEETRGLIGETELRLMKPSAYLLNTARGPIIHEAALIRALQEGWIAGAALDVFEQEPVSPNNPLLSMENVILAPHAIGWTHELMHQNGVADCQGILKVISGEAPDATVNRDVLQKADFQTKLNHYRNAFGPMEETSE